MKKLLRPSPAILIALLALFVALGVPSYAAKMITGKNIKNSSVTGQDIKNSSLTGQDIKNSSLTGQDIKNDSLTGQDIKNGSVQGSDLKGGVLSAVSLPTKKANATNGATEALAQAAAPEITLYKSGALTVYGKCYTDTSTDQTYYGTFIKTSQNYAIFDSRDDELYGGPAFVDFLNISSDEGDRQLDGDYASLNDATMYSEDNSDFTAFAPDGTALRGWTGGASKNGALAAGNGVYGSGNVCLFTGGVFSG